MDRIREITPDLRSYFTGNLVKYTGYQGIQDVKFNIQHASTTIKV